MRFTERTDIAVRLLLFLALHKGAKLSVDEIVDRYLGHRSQVVAAIQDLRRGGYIGSSPGRSGGVWLVRSAHEITLAEIVRMFETDFHLTRCFKDGVKARCLIYDVCVFKQALERALGSFFAVLEETTIADLIEDEGRMLQVMEMGR
ncbi:RrF2 family transcriptional regulator [Polymorphum gilvum]|uniref:Rhizobial iron transcriptional regulator protein n=1 Tax=Polymorphum gilvum (strain LMG 25793 / CGMCC 1.9160 / SL003B-26A1) TaxID=991905 RepID=F2IW88_POLGS|nr:Rrf2 family transcriptional regulator [Polymorphum gilvum]ADZ71473.1 Rhizobial iron transcriptional regulator protein [Polymorphum gilvum SL003B-26A1]